MKLCPPCLMHAFYREFCSQSNKGLDFSHLDRVFYSHPFSRTVQLQNRWITSVSRSHTESIWRGFSADEKETLKL